MRSPHALLVLQQLAEASEEVKEMIRDEMMKTEGFVWDINVGFHAIPSMRWVDGIPVVVREQPTQMNEHPSHLHLHVISSDLISPSLKTKRHYQTFNPQHGFFLHLEDVQNRLTAGNDSVSVCDRGGIITVHKSVSPCISFQGPLRCTKPCYGTT
jgi:aprataxin